MKIVFTTEGINWDSKMDPRFGRAKYYVVYDEETKELVSFDNSDVEGEAHGAGPKAARKIVEYKADILITGNGPGGNASKVLEKIGTQIYIGAGDMSIEESYKAYKNGSLNKF